MEASTSKATAPKHARLAEAPPALPRGAPANLNDHHHDDEDEHEAGGSEGEEDESDFDESTVKTEGGLISKLANLDERTFEDKKHVALREIDDDGKPVDGTDDQEEVDEATSNAELLAEFPDDTDELELTHSRIRSLKGMNLGRFAKTLKRLSFRQNLLTGLLVDGQGPIEQLTELEEIDLYDNRISHVKGLKGLSKLQSLDLSFNLLRKVPADQLDTLKAIKILYFIQNKISHIDGLNGVADTLESVEFGGNKLRKIENLDLCVNLTELWLGKNKITKLEGLNTLKNLKILSIQSNRITKLEGLEGLESLEEIYLSHNGIKKLEGLEQNKKLRVLDIANNFVKDVENIGHLTQLEEFWANNNLIDDFSQIEAQMGKMENLDTVYLEGNPVQAQAGANYRRKVMLALPQVAQIDATYVRRQ